LLCNLHIRPEQSLGREVECGDPINAFLNLGLSKVTNLVPIDGGAEYSELGIAKGDDRMIFAVFLLKTVDQNIEMNVLSVRVSATKFKKKEFRGQTWKPLKLKPNKPTQPTWKMMT
jgi:hypothetical protein